MALCALVLATVGAVGCGEEEGVADGATVNAYAEQEVCGRMAGYSLSFRTEDGEMLGLRIHCLSDPRGPDGVDLAVVGANARRATEDSTSVAYLQARDPAVNRFTEPILDEAGIGWITAANGEAQRRLMEILSTADSSSLRADVREALGQG